MARKRTGSRPTYFTSLRIENVRCFSKLQTLDLTEENGRPAQWTLVLGDNGVGKTTLLQALSMLEPTIFRGSDGNGTPSGDDDGRWFPKGQDRLFKSIDYEYRGERWDLNNFARETGGALHCSFALDWKFSDRAKAVPETGAISLEGGGARFSGRNVTKERKEIVPLKCYAYGAGRKMGVGAISRNLRDDPVGSLFEDDHSLRNAEEWLLQTDYAAMKQENSNTSVSTFRFEKVRSLLIDLLPDVDDIQISPFLAFDLGPLVEFHTPYGWVPMRDLSLGYRTLVAWTVDLASRMVERYPTSKNPLAEPAIVLVDEIDLHLHPRWQRQLMAYLTDLFPNTQFIVTAHSPLVVQAAETANIVVLRREGDHVVIDNDPEVIQGWRIDQVLTSDLFGLESARPPQLEGLLSERKRLLTKARLTASDRKKLKRLEDEIGDLPAGENLQDAKAMEIIRQAARTLEKQNDEK